jgi:hypothetical protein
MEAYSAAEMLCSGLEYQTLEEDQELINSKDHPVNCFQFRECSDGLQVRFLAGARDVYLLHCIQTGSGAHPSSCPVGTGSFFPLGE